MRERIRKLLVCLSKRHKPRAPYTSIFSYLAYIVDEGLFWWGTEMYKRCIR